MAQKEYKTGTKRYYVSKTGKKRNRKEVDKKNEEYKKVTYERVNVRIRKDETEVLEKLNSVKSKNNYIVELIRADIKASKD